MIFHRLAVSHFKGIKNVEVNFAPRGITLVEGRNEIGKSSLVHALTTLFEEPVSRTRGKLAHLIPKDGGGTPEITLEAESGNYRFVFRKSFVENKAVELTILRPAPERYEGKEAQENLDRILNDTLDRALWKALMLQQGSAVGLPEVKDQQALMEALDSAVAGTGGAFDAESLYGRVAAEYGKYYHAGHSGELQRLRDLREAAGAAAEAAEGARERLAELEDKIARGRRLRQSLRSLDERETAEQRMRSDCEALLSKVDTLEKALEAEKTRQEHAGENRRNAERGLEPRRRLVGLERETRESLADMTKALEEARFSESEAARVAEEKKTLLDRHVRDLGQAEKLAALRRADYEHHRDLFDLQHMRERRGRIDASRALVCKAKAELADNAVTDKAAKEIRDAEKAAELARARLEGLAPRLRLDALADCSVVLDGDAVRLTPGETRESPVLDAASLEIPGMLSVRVTVGDGGDLNERLARANERLRALLAKYGVGDPADAPVLLEKRREAERIVADGGRVEEENLRDLAYSGDAGGLVERILELEEKVSGYLRNRAAEPSLPESLDLAKRERDNTEKIREAAMRDHREALAVWDTAETARQNAKEALIGLEAEKAGAERELERVRLNLTESRSGVADADLEKAFAEADGEYSDASRNVAVLAAEVMALGPELLRGRLETLKAASARTEREKSEAREQLARLEVELELLGGNGLNEKLEEAEAALEYRTRLLDAELRRAGAARLLYETIAEARERSQKAYILPLKSRIEDLARSVYNTGVEVELTPDLQIASRTMNGLEVAFSQLSGGAREQFSLIHRAACSLAVSGDGGVPLILDDALGYSDNYRLMGMNEVLSRAARKCQIIILTCMPNRYAYVEPAARIDMEELNR